VDLENNVGEDKRKVITTTNSRIHIIAQYKKETKKITVSVKKGPP
jgi:hypothetical protein